MRRRGLLISLGSLTAGCVSIASTGPATRTPASEPTRSIPEAYRITDLSVATNNNEYALSPVATYSAEEFEQRREESDEPLVVMGVSEIENTDTREAIEAAIRNEGWRSDSLPAGLAHLVERVDAFTGVSEASDPYVELELLADPAAIAFDASVIDDRVSVESPGVIEFALRNTGRSVRTITGGTLAPFGLVRAWNDSGIFLLWRDYEEDTCVSLREIGEKRCLVETVIRLEPGEKFSERFEILHATTDHYPDRTVPPGPGTYRVTDTIENGEKRGDSTALSYEVEFTLEPA